MQAERKQLFDYINRISFPLTICSFIWTPTEDTEALAYMNELIPCRKKALKEYQEKYMPLLIDGTDSENCWKWSTTPWPWERGYY